MTESTKTAACPYKCEEFSDHDSRCDSCNATAVDLFVEEIVRTFIAYGGRASSYGVRGLFAQSSKVEIRAHLDRQRVGGFRVEVSVSWPSIGSTDPEGTEAFAMQMLAASRATAKARELLTLGLAMFGDDAFVCAVENRLEGL